jgi:putative solute:sodium symporter small subunit
MNVKLAAFIILFLSIMGMASTVRIYRKDKLSTRLFAMWMVIWFAIGFFSLFPSALDRLRLLVNMGDRLFFLTTGAILLLYIIIFYVTSNLSKMSRKLNKLAQEIAILNHNLEDRTKEEANKK